MKHVSLWRGKKKLLKYGKTCQETPQGKQLDK